MAFPDRITINPPDTAPPGTSPTPVTLEDFIQHMIDSGSLDLSSAVQAPVQPAPPAPPDIDVDAHSVLGNLSGSEATATSIRIADLAMEIGAQQLPTIGAGQLLGNPDMKNSAVATEVSMSELKTMLNLDSIAAGSIMGRAAGSGSGQMVELTGAQVRSILNVREHTQVSGNSFMGNPSAGPAKMQVMTPAQAAALIEPELSGQITNIDPQSVWGNPTTSPTSDTNPPRSIDMDTLRGMLAINHVIDHEIQAGMGPVLANLVDLGGLDRVTIKSTYSVPGSPPFDTYSLYLSNPVEHGVYTFFLTPTTHDVKLDPDILERDGTTPVTILAHNTLPVFVQTYYDGTKYHILWRSDNP